MNAWPHQSDDAWIEELLRGLTVWAEGMVGRQDAEDAAIETIIRLLAERCDLVGKDAGRRMASRMLRNVCVDWHRRGGRLKLVLSEVLADQSCASGGVEAEEEQHERQAKARREAARTLRGLRVTLRIVERRVFRLVRKGLGNQDIAAQLQITERSVRRARCRIDGKVKLVRGGVEKIRVQPNDVPAVFRSSPQNSP